VTLLLASIDVMNNHPKKFSLDEICALVEMNKRKVRYYIQHELVDRPEGVSGKGAFYTHRHIEQLLTVKKWKEAGLNLERIKEITNVANKNTNSANLTPPPRPKKPGSVEVWSHLHIADGIELHIEPNRSGMTPEQIRALCRNIMEQYEQIIKDN